MLRLMIPSKSNNSLPLADLVDWEVITPVLHLVKSFELKTRLIRPIDPDHPVPSGTESKQLPHPAQLLQVKINE
jgi:hypothetical protein